jgi:hypothetical protein
MLYTCAARFPWERKLSVPDMGHCLSTACAVGGVLSGHVSGDRSPCLVGPQGPCGKTNVGPLRVLLAYILKDGPVADRQYPER